MAFAWRIFFFKSFFQFGFFSRIIHVCFHKLLAVSVRSAVAQSFEVVKVIAFFEIHYSRFFKDN